MRGRMAGGWMAAAVAVGMAAGALAGPNFDLRNEVVIAAGDFDQLDSFEGVMLGKADRAFAAGEFRRAAAEYDSFILQYPRSTATAYALLRKGRSLQLDNKRFDAIKVYNEVLDYFPNALEYAGAALYYLGDSHWQNGDPKAAMTAWAEMAQDTDYRQHRLAAGAINALADNLVRQDKANEAIAYYRQVGIDFHGSNPDAAQYAIRKALDYYIRTQPDEPKLRAFFDEAKGFDHQPGRVEESRYWDLLLEGIDRNGAFNDADRANRERYYRYWADALDPKNPTWDDFQVRTARYRLLADGDTAKWIARLDRQFAQFQKDGDYGRVIRWIAYYAGQKAKIDEYYAKLSFDKMTNAQILDLILLFYDRGLDNALARNTLGKLRQDQMTDDSREQLAGRIWNRDEQGLMLVYATMTDPARATMGKVSYFHATRQAEQGLKIVDEAIRAPAYAKRACGLKAEMLQWLRRWPEAIAAYKLADNPPTTIFRIAECLLADGKRDEAVTQLREIENFFPNDAPEAGLRIACAYRDSGDQKQYIAGLRSVMKKYPASGQSSTAHQELERMGVRIGGGVDAE